MERISSYQLFCLTLLYLIGITFALGFAAEAGKDAWIVIFLSTLLGLVNALMYLSLTKMQPGRTLVEWFPTQLGKWLGTPIAWLFPLVFLYNTSRTLTDVGDLLSTTILEETPKWACLSLFLLIIAFGLYKGIETLARCAEIILPFIFLLFFLVLLVLLISESPATEKLQPVLENGWKPVWKSTFPLGLLMSSGEVIGFAMIWPSVEKNNSIIKPTLYAVLLAGLLIFILDILAIAIIGEYHFQLKRYPLYYLLQHADIVFLRNLDAIGVVYLSALAFLKISIQAFVVIRGVQILTNLQNSRVLIIPILMIILYLAVTAPNNIVEHIHGGFKILSVNFAAPVFLYIPALLWIIIMIKKYVLKK
jgi:spore germination protein KB